LNPAQAREKLARVKSQRSSPQNFVGAIYLSGVALCFVALPIVSFLVCHLFFPKFAGLTIIPAVLLSAVLAQFLPRQICRWCGASLERQVVTPFDFKTRSSNEIEAEIRYKIGCHCSYGEELKG